VRVSWRRIFFLFVILCGILGGLKLGFATPSSFCFLEGRGMITKLKNFKTLRRWLVAPVSSFAPPSRRTCACTVLRIPKSTPRFLCS
jgi:hypothetical protein